MNSKLQIKESLKKIIFLAKGSITKLDIGKEKFKCPLCNYEGPFRDAKRPTGERKNAQCPNCGSYERHRLQKLVFDSLEGIFDFSSFELLHFAPEPYFSEIFKGKFRTYRTADINRNDVDIKLDLRNLPFPDGQFDCIFASHVLEHIKEDEIAIFEMRRVLRTRGLAFIEVPIVSNRTMEYDKAYELGHFRAPGLDYYDKFNKYFDRVEIYYSSDFPPIYQTFLIENRMAWPSEIAPLRKPMVGEKHIGTLAVCYT